jgi:hypothetical protein
MSRNTRSKAAKKEFEKLVKKEGWSFGNNYKYVNTDTIVPLICENGHIADRTPVTFKKGNRCKICVKNDKRIKAKKEFEKLLKNEGWSFSGIYEYVNTHTIVGLICNNGHDADKTPHSFKSGKRCKICSGLDSKMARNEFENLVIEEGWSFGENYEYVNTNTMVELICDKGHIADKTPGSFKSGARCGICIGEHMGENKLKVFKGEFEKFVIKEGWSFGDNYEYIDSNTIASLICDKGHIADKTPGSFKSGTRCKICYGNDTETARNEFENLVIEEGWSFGENYEYVNTNTMVELICDKGHIADKRPADFKRGDRCKICSGNDSEIAKEEFEQLVIEEGWSFGENYKYINAITNVILICDDGHIADKTPHSFKSGKRCKICARNDSEFAKQEFEKLVIKEGWSFGKNYEYINTHTIAALICDKGHIADKTPGNFKCGKRCGTCKNKTEKKLLSYLQKYY